MKTDDMTASAAGSPEQPADAASPKQTISLFRWVLRGFLLLAIVLLLALLLRPRLTVTLKNFGSRPLTSVRLTVTGSETFVGNLAAGAERTVRIYPASDSDLKLEYVDESGDLQRIDAGGYFGRSTSGRIEVDIRDGKVADYREDTHL